MSSSQALMDSLFGLRFEVPSSVLPELKYTCRRLPYTTLMFVLNEVAVRGGRELVKAQAAITPTDGETQQNATTNAGLVVFQSMVVSSGPAMERIVKDCVADPILADSTVKDIPVEDMVLIVSEVLSRVDAALLVEKFKQGFTQAAEVFNSAMEQVSPKEQNPEA